jgi:hypothetical protein
MRKAFGRSAGIMVIAINLATIAAMIALLGLPNSSVTMPAMTVLGPLMVVQYGYWLRRLGQERTTWQYLQADPFSQRTGCIPAPGSRVVATVPIFRRRSMTTLFYAHSTEPEIVASVLCSETHSEGRIGHREWARRNGGPVDIHSVDDRLDNDVDELMA